MKKLIGLPNEELELIIQNTADKMNIAAAIVEKDLWVCVILKYLFSDFKYKDYIVFKGGTSLSKVFKLIERFSEDIDLALDWQVLGHGEREPYEDRSKSGQLKYNLKLNDETAIFLKNQVLPTMQEDFEKILKNRNFNFYIDEHDPQTICFDYPKNYTELSILQVIRLEIGSLAEPIPASKHVIKTYIGEAYPSIFDDKSEVKAVDSIRTFYEKITILHREANRINGNYPTRYSRHFYDVYKMLLTDLRDESFNQLELLKAVIEFKKKFYACNWARYDEIFEGNLKLIPPKEGIEVFSRDFTSMQNMLFGTKISFDKIIDEINQYEKEFNRLLSKYKE